MAFVKLDATIEPAWPDGVTTRVFDGSDAALPTSPLHYDEIDVRGSFHHSREEVDEALALLARGAVDWRAWAAGPIGLDDLAQALAKSGGRAQKWVVHP